MLIAAQPWLWQQMLRFRHQGKSSKGDRVVESRKKKKKQNVEKEGKAGALGHSPGLVSQTASPLLLSTAFSACASIPPLQHSLWFR